MKTRIPLLCLLLAVLCCLAGMARAADKKNFDAKIEVAPPVLQVKDGEEVILTVTITNTGKQAWSPKDLAKAPQLGFGPKKNASDRTGHKKGFDTRVNRVVCLKPLQRDRLVNDRIDLWNGRKTEINPGDTVHVVIPVRFTRNNTEDAGQQFTEGVQLVCDSGPPSREWADGWFGDVGIFTFSFAQ